MKKKRLLVLCSDNRFRSPLLHAILRQYHKLDVVSAGFDENSVRQPAPQVCIKAAAELGIDLSRHKAITLEPCLIDWADEFLFFDSITQMQFRIFCEEAGMARPSRRRCHMMGKYTKSATPSIPNPLEIPGDLDFYNEIIDDIVYAGHKLARILSGYEQKGE